MRPAGTVYRARYKSPGKAPPYDGKEHTNRAHLELEVYSLSKKFPAATVHAYPVMGAPESEWSKVGEWSHAEGWMWYE